MSLTTKIKALLDYANGVTEKEDTTLGDAVKSLADGYGQGGGADTLKALIDRSITSIEIPDGITSVGAYAFYTCRTLTSVMFPNSVTSIGNNTFDACELLSSINFPNGLTIINSYAFRNCKSLIEVILPDSLTRLEGLAFQQCNVLQKVTIGTGITYIGLFCFQNCPKLTTMTIKATTPPSLYSSASISSYTTAIYVPADSVDAYKAASGWSTYADIISAIEE